MAIYRVLMSVEITADHDGDAHQQALRVAALLKSPLLKMAASGEGVQLVEDGRPVVHQPIRQ